MEKLKIITPIILVLTYTGLLLSIPRICSKHLFFSISKNEFINFQINYQFCLLIIATIAVTTTYFLNKEGFTNYFSIGNISVQAEEMKIFGIKKGDSWLKTGISLSIFISLATTTFMYFQLKNANVDFSLLKSAFIWILLFSLTNSFCEEMIYRLAIISPLKNLLSPMTIFIVSAVLFGLPHFAGMPSGLLGAVMAGLLGLVLAKSVYETNGLFWAWFIHFLQDVIIIGSLFLLSSKT